MRYRLDPTSSTGISSEDSSKSSANSSGSFAMRGADGRVQSIVAGTNVTVNNTDPANPIVSATGGGGGGGSVNSVTAGDATITVAGTATDPTIAVNAIPESKVTNLVSDLAGKQATGNYLTALTGDGTASGPGSATLTLTSVVTGGTVGDATHIPVLTYDNKGRITSVTTATPTASAPTQRTFVTAMGF